MKRLGMAVLGAVSLALLMAGPAFAQGSPIGPPDDEVGPQVILKGQGDATGGLAFAGSAVTVWMVLAAILLVAGLALLIAGRRRARRAPQAAV